MAVDDLKTEYHSDSERVGHRNVVLFRQEEEGSTSAVGRDPDDGRSYLPVIALVGRGELLDRAMASRRSDEQIAELQRKFPKP